MLVTWLTLPPATTAGQRELLPARTAQAELRRTNAETDLARAEATKLEHDDLWTTRLLSYLAPFLTAAGAAAGVFFSVWRVGSDRRDAIDREARERDAAREAAEVERFDERFAKAVEGLSSTKPGEQMGAAVLVVSMVRDRREELSDQALQLLLVSLQAQHDEACERLLRYALERFARSAPSRLVATVDHEAVGGLAHVRASDLDLSGIDLAALDIAFSVLPGADFRRSNLRGCKGFEARLEKARFDEADLSDARWVKARAPGAKFQKATVCGANFFRADLSGANFYSADLSKTSLRYTTLTGSSFWSANLRGTDFYGAEMDERALASILKASDWRAAEFSREVWARLEQLDTENKGERQAL